MTDGKEDYSSWSAVPDSRAFCARSAEGSGDFRQDARVAQKGVERHEKNQFCNEHPPFREPSSRSDRSRPLFVSRGAGVSS